MIGRRKWTKWTTTETGYPGKPRGSAASKRVRSQGLLP